MKVLVFSLAVAVAVATINADCIHCSNNKEDHQEIKYEDLISSENGSWENKYTTESTNVVDKFRIIQKIIQKYPMYAEEAKQALKFSDPLNLVDTTEFLANGEIEYKNAMFSGLENSVLKDVSFNEIEQNLFSVYAVLAKAEVTGDYVAANGSKKESGQFYMTLKNVEFRTKFNINHFMEIQHEINANEAITFSQHESAYTNEEVLNALENDNTDVQKPYAYYYNYLNGVIKSRIANEMTASFVPLIAKRLEQKLRASVLFQTNNIQVPKSYAHIAAGIQAQVNNILLQDMKNTDIIQKLTNYTVDREQTEMLFSFTSFDLRGINKWQLKYSNTGNVYAGDSVFAVDNVQTVISVIKSNGNGAMKIKFVKTTVNGLTLMLGTENNNCVSIRNFVLQRVPHVLEESLKTYFNEQSKIVLRNQILLLGEQTQ